MCSVHPNKMREECKGQVKVKGQAKVRWFSTVVFMAFVSHTCHLPVVNNRDSLISFCHTPNRESLPEDIPVGTVPREY